MTNCMKGKEQSITVTALQLWLVGWWCIGEQWATCDDIFERSSSPVCTDGSSEFVTEARGAMEVDSKHGKPCQKAPPRIVESPISRAYI